VNVSRTSKRKIFNDPIYGFITIPNDFVFDLIEHPYFQRLRRISQMGFSNLVYTGANHTRFQHTLGAMHLMSRAIETLRSKGHEITDAEAVGATVAILMHDIGHGPFSHTLEFSLVKGVNHEQLSALFMAELNRQFDVRLSLAIEIFNGTYHKKFLHQLVSSQLDTDRLDYLKRDSFFTGVSEGVIGSERLITMLDVKDGEIAVEAKGIYSVEKFLIARRIMYWQVYLHKTVLAAEMLLIRILKRAKELALNGEELFCSEALEAFLYHEYTLADFKSYHGLLDTFAKLDDIDIMSAIKVWQSHTDTILSTLCKMLIDRKLYRIEIGMEPFGEEKLETKKSTVLEHFDLDDPSEVDYFVFSDQVMNRAYSQEVDTIRILFKNGEVKDVAEAADLLNISVLSKPVTKYFMCYPKFL